jgi:hypothetical protein
MLGVAEAVEILLALVQVVPVAGAKDQPPVAALQAPMA